MNVLLYPASTPTGHVWLASSRSALGEQSPWRTVNSPPTVKDDKPMARLERMVMSLVRRPPRDAEWLTTQQVADHFGVSAKTIQRMKTDGESRSIEDPPWRYSRGASAPFG